MIGIEGLDPTTQAIAVLVIVLIQALVLYVGYGKLTDLLAPPLLRAISKK